MQPRAFEQPESFTSTDPVVEAARQTVVETEEMFMRGELSSAQVDDIREIMGSQYVERLEKKKTFRDTSLVNQQVRVRKLHHKVKNLLLTCVNKAKGTTRFRPGKQKSTLKQLTKRFDKVKKGYLKLGFGQSHWEDFVNAICVEMGSKLVMFNPNV